MTANGYDWFRGANELNCQGCKKVLKRSRSAFTGVKAHLFLPKRLVSAGPRPALQSYKS